MGRRILPLLLVFALGALVLMARLWSIQVTHNTVWADEAARLVHSGEVLSYERGRILARDGSVLVRDKPTYHLFLVYRDFRRGHPLGQVAHARSLLEGRAVPLQEAQGSLVPWAEDLARLLPRELEAWAEGDAVEREGWSAPALEGDREDRRETARRLHRGRRVADVRFYLRRLLGVEDRRWRALTKRIERSSGRRSFLEVAAEERGLEESELLAEMQARLFDVMAQLERFASLAKLDEDGVSARSAPPGLSALDLVVRELERTRTWVEDASASKMFAEAAGFAPGRIDPELLLTRIDLDWIANLFAWDEARLQAWSETARRAWTEVWRDGWALPRLHADLVLDASDEAEPEDVLDRLMALYNHEGGVVERLDLRHLEPESLEAAAVPGWNEEDRQCVLDDLDAWLAVDVPAELRSRALLPYRDAALRSTAAEWADPDRSEVLSRFEERPDPWKLLDGAFPASTRFPAPLPLMGLDDLEDFLGSSDAAQVAGVTGGRRLGRVLRVSKRAHEDLTLELMRRAARRWDGAFQDSLALVFEELCAAADEGEEVTADGRLVIAPASRDRAIERADYYLKDYGLRPRALTRTEPDYVVVNLLSRFWEDFPGIQAREAWEREVVTFEGDPGPLATGIVGRTSAVDERLLVANRDRAQRLRELWNQPRRGREEEEELFSLVGEVLLPDEIRGVSGIEGFYDPELSGSNGYREEVGLQEVREAGVARRRREPVHGEDVRLTLDLDLQRAAERILANPPVIASNEKFDHAWAADPVGAIVMITTTGDVLVAASEPTPFEEPAPDDTGQRANPIERTLLLPSFQPPGSVLKPLVGWYALSEMDLDPTRRVTCAWIPGGGSGYGSLRCWRTAGHGDVDLDSALVGSCNAYFAWLGEVYDPAGFLDLAALFGLDRKTGVRNPPPGGSGLRRRLGLREDFDPFVFKGGKLDAREKLMAGNGLGVLSTTPLQVARAFAALGTGVLPQLRLVEAIGSDELERERPVRLPLDDGARRRIVSSLANVANDRAGTAYKTLSEKQLGFRLAAKTGSADFTSRVSEGSTAQVRKHTWIAGFVPVEDPVAVFVIFVHNTSTTSSNGAAYVAESFLQTEAVRAHLAAEGVPMGPITER